MDGQKSKNNMARSSLLKKFALIVLLTLSFSSQVYPQIKLTGMGASLGFGSLRSNSPSVNTFGGDAFLDFKLWFSEDVKFRFAFTHLRDADYYFSGSQLIKNYPFINSYSLRSFLDQPVSESISIEEGIGLLYLNDRFFSSSNSWGLGTVFHVKPYLDFRSAESSGFKVGLCIEYGFTFSADVADYYQVALQANYCL